MSASAKAVFEADSSKLDSALLRVRQSMLKLQRMVVAVEAALGVRGELPLIAKRFSKRATFVAYRVLLGLPDYANSSLVVLPSFFALSLQGYLRPG